MLKDNSEIQNHQMNCGFRKVAKRLLGDKRGMELAMTVVVLIIISIIIFIGGLALVWKFFAGAEEIKSQIDRSTQQQIETLLLQGNEIVAIPINTKTVRTGTDTTFGLGIRNVGRDTQDYFVRIDLAGIYDQKGKYYPEIDAQTIEQETEQLWLGGFQEHGPISVAKHEFKIVPLYVRVNNAIAEGVSTPKGANVVFNVCVYADVYTGQECVLGDPSIYDKVHQITIKSS